MRISEKEALIKSVGFHVAAKIDKALSPIIARMDAIESQIKALPVPKELDLDAVSNVVFLRLNPELDEIRSSVFEVRKSVDEFEPYVDEAAVKTLIAQEVDEAIGALPKPEEVETPEPINVDEIIEVARAAAEVAAVKWCEENPPKDGMSVDPDEVEAWVSQAIDDGLTKAVASIPVPKDGVGLAGFIIDRSGHLIATTTSGDVKDLGLVVGKDGENVDKAGVETFIHDEVSKAIQAIPKPKNGKDGFSLKDFDVTTRDDGRTMVLSFTSEDVTQEVELDIPLLIYRGIREEGHVYKRGDVVTWAGSSWHCEGETTDKPGESKSWRLMVKKGRDGREVVTVAPDPSKPVKVDGK